MNQDNSKILKILEFLSLDDLDPVDAFMLGQEYPEAQFGCYGNEIKATSKFAEFLVVYTGVWDEEIVDEYFEENINDNDTFKVLC